LPAGFGLIAETKESGKWVTLIGRFSSQGSGPEKLKLMITGDGITYFDNVRIEPALKYRLNPSTSKEQFMHSVCRLYPERDSLACDYYDSAGLRRKGWSGYCLEYDPRNPSACLMWYPLDKVASEEFEEGIALNIKDDLYYCIYAEDQCQIDEEGQTLRPTPQPEFYCKTFMKVNKDNYWYDRINEGSDYVLQPGIFGRDTNLNKMFVDMGIDNDTKIGGKVTKSIEKGISWSAGSGFYGALSSEDSIIKRTSALSFGTDSKGPFDDRRILPFLSFYGVSRAGNGGTNDSYFCRATVDSNGKDYPYIMELGDGEQGTNDYVANTTNKYDDCYVRGLLDGDFDGDCRIEDNKRNNIESGAMPVCCGWNADSGRCSLSGVRGWNYCPNPFTCKNYRCVSTNEDNGDECSANPTVNPQPRYTINNGDPDTRCSVAKKDDYTYSMVTTDIEDDADEVICLFDCFNHTNKYSIGASKDNAIYAVRRLFSVYKPDNSENFSCYTWDPLTNRYNLSSSACQLSDNNGPRRNIMSECAVSSDRQGNSRLKRPDFDQNNKNADWCYIAPQIFNVSVSPKEIVKEGYVMVTFNTIIDLSLIHI